MTGVARKTHPLDDYIASSAVASHIKDVQYNAGTDGYAKRIMMLELVSEHACHGGMQRFYKHDSQAIGLPMRFSVFIPPHADGSALPALFYLAGLTCTEETFAVKAGAQRVAAELGLVLVAPDASPRGAGVPGETDAWDFGVGAGFYLDATQAPWSQHYRMESYITAELLPLLAV